MKKRHETRRVIVYKQRWDEKEIADELEVDEALSDLDTPDEDEPNWDELAEIAEMADFAERGLRIF